MTKKTKSSAITKPAIDENDLCLIDDNGIVSNELKSVEVNTKHLSVNAKKVLILLMRYSGKTESEVVSEVFNAWIEKEFRGKPSRSNMLVEDTLDQVEVEQVRLEKEMRNQTRKIAEEKQKELEDISIQIRHFAG